MNNFKLDIFSRMCDQLIEEIKSNAALMETHMSRFEDTHRSLYPDKNLHILVNDIIYCSQAYNFYGDMSFNPINAQSRKLHFERVAKAKELLEAVEKATTDASQLDSAKQYIATIFTKTKKVNHKAFGEGTIENCSGMVLSVFFPKINETKRLGLAVAVENGLLTLESEEETKRVKEDAPLLKREPDISKKLVDAIEELQPYLEFIE